MGHFISDCNLGKYEKLALLDALKIYFQRFFALNFFAFNIKWTKWRSYQLNDVDCGFAINFCVVYLVKAHSYLISSSAT